MKYEPFRPLRASPGYFTAVLRGILEAVPLSSVTLAAPGSLPARSNDPPSFVLEGGQRAEINCRSGEAIFWSRHASSYEFWDMPVLHFGIVFRRSQLRFLMVDFPGGPPPEVMTPWAYHTKTPLLPLEAQCIEALEQLAQASEPQPETAQHLLLGLMHAALHHLETDSDGAEARPALWTWLRVQDYLHDHFEKSLSRESVASALRIHPNYLSSVCAQHGGITFWHELRRIRVDRARRLLLETALPLEEVAGACGFSGTEQMARAFKRELATTPTALRRQ